MLINCFNRVIPKPTIKYIFFEKIEAYVSSHSTGPSHVLRPTQHAPALTCPF